MSIIPPEIKEVEIPSKTEIRLFNKTYYVYPYEVNWDKEKKRPVKRTGAYLGKILQNPKVKSMSTFLDLTNQFVAV